MKTCAGQSSGTTTVQYPLHDAFLLRPQAAARTANYCPYRSAAGNNAVPAAHRHVDVKIYGALDCLDKVVCVAALCCFMEVLWRRIFNKVIHTKAR